ncbi:hypothetical protein Q5P01_021251 [Channa striata]|uniref:Uncharacterized protein n=1 Tax=Channa striata TaxID=64152 RepID=A0AA88RYG7_CHASR|nr:hypothetical protein Q5P01_021251 [Channa striata]
MLPPMPEICQQHQAKCEKQNFEKKMSTAELTVKASVAKPSSEGQMVPFGEGPQNSASCSWGSTGAAKSKHAPLLLGTYKSITLKQLKDNDSVLSGRRWADSQLAGQPELTLPAVVLHWRHTERGSSSTHQ